MIFFNHELLNNNISLVRIQRVILNCGHLRVASLNIHEAFNQQQTFSSEKDEIINIYFSTSEFQSTFIQWPQSSSKELSYRSGLSDIQTNMKRGGRFFIQIRIYQRKTTVPKTK